MKFVCMFVLFAFLFACYIYKWSSEKEMHIYWESKKYTFLIVQWILESQTIFTVSYMYIYKHEYIIMAGNKYIYICQYIYYIYT